MPAKRIEFTVSEETWQRIEVARGAVPRAAWIKLALESALRGSEFDKAVDDDPEKARAMFERARGS